MVKAGDALQGNSYLCIRLCHAGTVLPGSIPNSSGIGPVQSNFPVQGLPPDISLPHQTINNPKQ